ncbi:patatin-like phospholipase family protein [Deefgea rivuli]|uniref:patatin-like phospholipase family protein n=1 Tax=Deefgea rivuli TaxID=400948 RepID=UPI0004800279|nr:patatin-like phospholipase family protein [Deefgea rivuli]
MQEIALLLQGGGALGAYELGVLRYMGEQNRLPVQLVAGVSIGAVNAAVLVGSRDADPIAALNTLWEKLTVPHLPFLPEVFEQNRALLGNPHMSRLRHDYWNMQHWTALYSADPLRELLHELIDFDKLNASATELQLSAVQIESGDVEIFSNRQHIITAEHVIASLSIPPMFPPVEIDGLHYWDGGLFDNAPLRAMIDALPVGSATRFVIINLFPLKGQLPDGLAQVQDRMLEIIFSNKTLGDMAQMQTYNELTELAAALDKELAADSSIRQQAGFLRIQKYRYFEDPIVITNDEPESQEGTLDFSGKSLARRTEAGYRDAVRIFNAN